MKAAVLYEYDPEMNVELKLESVPEPTIQAPDEVIVRIGAAGLCRTDNTAKV
jgi:NAD+-dependent secondary alcohol dehydrogenase Adh1